MMPQINYYTRWYMVMPGILIASIYGIKYWVDAATKGFFLNADIFIVFVCVWWAVNFGFSRWRILNDELRAEWVLGTIYKSKTLVQLKDIEKIDCDWQAFYLHHKDLSNPKTNLIQLSFAINNVNSLVKEILAKAPEVQITVRAKRKLER